MALHWLEQAGVIPSPAPCPWAQGPVCPSTVRANAARPIPFANSPESQGCWNQSARPLCSHGIIPPDLRRVELFKQMAQIIRVAGVSARRCASSMLPDTAHVTRPSQHDAGGTTLSAPIGFHGLTCRAAERPEIGQAWYSQQLPTQHLLTARRRRPLRSLPAG